MPMDKDLKRLVRARMAATNENYTNARAGLVGAVPRADLRPLVSMLADPAMAHATAATLKTRPPQLLVPALVAGLEYPEWRVRRSCCRLLDDLDFTAESLTALQRTLDEPDPACDVPRFIRSVASTASAVAVRSRSRRSSSGWPVIQVGGCGTLS